MRRFTMAAAVLVLSSFLAGASPLEIPLGSAPVIDGAFEPAEWSGARTVDFTANQGVVEIRAHLVHDGEQLYVAFEYTANPDSELIMPGILIGADNEKTAYWEDDNWWFHVSAQNCDARASTTTTGDAAQRVQPGSAARTSRPASPLFHLMRSRSGFPSAWSGSLRSGPFGFSLTVDAWPSDTRGYWPVGTSIESPATWGEAILLEQTVAQIAFGSDRDESVEIYVMDSDGTDLTRLTTRSGDDLAATWSPDGSGIAFSTTTSSYVLVLDTDELRKLPRGGQLNWSPDGSRIVFVRHAGGDTEIFVMNADGSNVRQLTDNDANDRGPS